MQAEPGGHQSSMPTKGGIEPLDPDDPPVFEHAPKPNTDPWEILFTHGLEADTERCTAWKDEVSNLLIFAGLFSAVVTAFLIESYKSLQPDPNDAVVGLLFHIATGLNNSSPFPPSVNPTSIATPFSQTPSSIRINVLWFISLVLSLTSVLVGTICLQWLREHQSYTGFSSKEKLAIFHMRSEALAAWYVPQIFSVLPVLLQGAVALFLAGLIDFVLPLGRELTIAISATVGGALLFLAMTTVLPTCQGLLFFTGIYPYRKPPTPCAFKSPQSRAVFAVFAPFLYLLSYIISGLYYLLLKISLFRRYDMLPHLREVLQQRSWATLDRKWLTLRDAYHQCIVDLDPDLYNHQVESPDCFPLSDITQFLVKSTRNSTAKYSDTFLGAAVYCFQDISASIWTDPPDDYNHQNHYIHRDRRNNYFEQLHLHSSDCSMAKYLLHNGAYRYRRDDSDEFSEYVKPTTRHLFHHDQILSFLVETPKSPALHRYQLELWIEVISKSRNLAPLTPIDDFSSAIPIILGRSTILSSRGDPPPYEEYLVGSDILNMIFKFAISHHSSQDQLTNSLSTNPQIFMVLSNLAQISVRYLHVVKKGTSKVFNQENIQDISGRYISIFHFVANYLNEGMSNSTSKSQEDKTNVLFYLASIFMCLLVDQANVLRVPVDNDSRPGRELASLFKVLLQYRTWIGTTLPARGWKIDMFQVVFKLLTGMDPHFATALFSDKWWRDLIQRGRQSGLKAADKGPASAKGSAPSDHPNTLSRGGSDLGNIEVQCTDPHPALMIDNASRSDIRDKDNGRHAPSSIPATANHTMGTSEDLDLVNRAPFPTSQLSSPCPETTQPAGGGQTAGDVARQVSSPAQPTVPSGNTSVLNMAHNQAAGRDSQPGGHVAVEVVQAIPGQVEPGTTGSNDGIVQERPMEGDAVISIPLGN